MTREIKDDEHLITTETEELNQNMLSFCERNTGRNELEYRCKFDNGEWDFQAMARFVIGKIGCSPEFEERIRKIHSEE